MKVKFLNRLMILIIVISLITIINAKESFAGVSASRSNVSINKGSSTTVTITGSDATGKVSVSSSNGNVASASISSNWLENSSVTVTINGNNGGNATINVTGVVSNSAGNETNVSIPISVTVNATSSGGGSSSSSSTSGASSSSSSSNSSGSNTITSLTVAGNTYSPGQTITVDNNTDSVTINAKTTNGASYTVNGSNNKTVSLKTGTNRFTVAVSNGKTYTVNIVRLAKDGEVKPNIMDESAEENNETQPVENKLFLTSLNVKNFELTPEFDSNVYSYTIDMNMLENDTSKLDIDAIPNLSDATVEIIGNDNLVEGENIITIMVNSADGTESVVYQIVVNKNDPSSETVSASIFDNIGFLSNLTPFQRNLLLGFAGFVLLIVIVVIIILIRKAKKKKKSKVPFESVDIEDGKNKYEIKDEIQQNIIDNIDTIEPSENIEENKILKEDKAIDNTDEVMKKTSLDKEKAALMDEFFSYNQSLEEENEAIKKEPKKRGKGKGKHF